MDLIYSYGLIITALGLVLLGIYGAAPLLFARRPRATARGQVTMAQQFFAAGPAFPLLQRDLEYRLGPTATAVLEPTPLDDLDPATAEPKGAPVAEAESDSLERLIGGLFTEIEMLRDQVQGLREELAGLSRVGPASLQCASDSSDDEVPEPSGPADTPRRKRRPARSQPETSLL
jgi:hypothetical protein